MNAFRGIRNALIPALILWALLFVGVHKACAEPLLTKVDWSTISANVGATVWSAQTTTRFLHNGSGCVESNPRLGLQPTNGAIVRNAALSIGLSEGIALGYRALVRSSHPKLARWFGRSVELSVAAVKTRSAVRNVYVCGW